MPFRSLLLALLFATALQAAPEYKWEKIEGCTLMPGEWNDGDSFTVRIKPRTFRTFRLYFVDTPEDGKDTRFPQRIQDQADYFGITTDRVTLVGSEGKAFTAKVLGDKPFTVYTLWRDAMGSGRRQRFFAMVEVDGRWLSSLLVKNGLARIHGTRVQLPCGTTSREYLAMLAGLELTAKAEKRGGWVAK